jgi:integrase
MKRRQSPFPPYTHNYRDRHGTLRSDFRRGAVRVALPQPLLGPEYWEAYRMALADFVAGRQPNARSEIGAQRTKAGSVAAAFIAYTGSASFKNDLASSTQAVHRNILRRWSEAWGDRPLRYLERRHVVGWLNERADTPAAAAVFLKVLRRMMAYCIEIGLLDNDPTQGVKPPKQRGGDGIHSWSEDEIEQYRRHHPLGSNARTALELLIGTAQRRSDVVRMGRQHLRDGTIHVTQQKTGWSGEIPIGPELADALAKVQVGNLTFLTTAWGAPFTAAGFGVRFRSWCNEAGLPAHCSAHGLRKAACRRLAEAGCTVHEIAAISGHVSLAEVQRYTKAVDQARLARAARNKSAPKIGEPTNPVRQNRPITN